MRAYSSCDGRIVIDPKARELVLKARLFRFFSFVFACAGVIVFVALYFQNIQGSFLSALTNPFVITIILVPFLPAAVLSFKASRLERQYLDKYGRKD